MLCVLVDQQLTPPAFYHIPHSTYMRKHHFSLGGAIFALILFVLTSDSVFAADSTSCIPDCPADAFSGEFQDVVELPNGCFVRVTWAKRLACGTWHDVLIKTVEPLTDECGVLSLPQLLAQASTALLEKNPMAFPPFANGRDTCVVNWRVVKGACWRYSVECGDTVAIPCGLTECCLTPYEVCLDTAGKRVVTPIGGGSTAECDTLSGCVPVCGGDGGSTGGTEIGTPELSSAPTLRRLMDKAILPRRSRKE